LKFRVDGRDHSDKERAAYLMRLRAVLSQSIGLPIDIVQRSFLKEGKIVIDPGRGLRIGSMTMIVHRGINLEINRSAVETSECIY